MLTNGLVTYLLEQGAITAIVGNTVCKVLPIPAPENLSEYPLITYQVASDVSEYGFDGSIGVTKSRVVFNCIAARYLDARNLALAVKAALNGFRGPLPDGTAVFETEIVNMQDNYNDGSRLTRVSVHALITYSD